MRRAGGDRQPVGQAVPDCVRRPGQPEAYANAKKRLRELKEQLQVLGERAGHQATQTNPAERDFAKADYLAAVEKAKELIAGGDFMQVQVGQRIKKRYTESR
jgi:anthranilate synthase component 1